ncbi:MAG: hypothetical protein H6970_13315 [Gammaproteobacteria bacterium]|nr:hypothetical protein [Gammaproteobacteria bacterium]
MNHRDPRPTDDRHIPDIALLQTALCFLMTRYTSRPNPGMAYAITNHLEMVLNHPAIAELPERSQVYRGLLAEWRVIASGQTPWTSQRQNAAKALH